MKINIFGSTGIIGTKSLKIINNYFPNISINLLCANNNVSKLIRQTNYYSPKFVYLNNTSKIYILKQNINKKVKILNFKELISYLNSTKSNLTILAVSYILYTTKEAYEKALKHNNGSCTRLCFIRLFG